MSLVLSQMVLLSEEQIDGRLEGEGQPRVAAGAKKRQPRMKMRMRMKMRPLEGAVDQTRKKMQKNKLITMRIVK